MKIMRLSLLACIPLILQFGTICDSMSLFSDNREKRHVNRHNGPSTFDDENVNGNLLGTSDGTYPRVIKYVTISKGDESGVTKNSLVQAWEWIRATTSDVMESVKGVFKKVFGI